MNDLSHDPTKLQMVLDGETDIVIRRDFSHPPARVWQGWTEPDVFKRWLSSPDNPMTRCDMDVRPGGAFHWAWANADGSSFYFHGTYQAVRPPYHLAHTEHFSGDPTYEAKITTDLAAHGSGTRMTVVMRYADAKARASAIAAGFTDGFDDVYSKLEAVL
jgi:uncharacterized protein YndB with AHSA1/START domain